MGWKPKSAEGIPVKRHQRLTWGTSMKGCDHIFNMMGKYKSSWGREMIEFLCISKMSSCSITLMFGATQLQVTRRDHFHEFE